MSRHRKSWEPEYRFGGNPCSFMKPRPLGENQNVYNTKVKGKMKRRKK